MDSSKPGQGWRARWLERRNRVLSSSSFQRFAARFPLARPVARMRARRLFDLVAGFTYSQVLSACVETRLLERLADAPLTTDELASAIDLPPDGALTLTRAAESLGLVESLGTRWALGQTGAELLGNRGIAAIVAHHRLLYADLADPVALLRRGGGGGALQQFWNYGADEPAAAAPYSALMAGSQALIAEQVIRSYPFRRHRRLLDIGGGDGTFLAALAAQAPRLDLTLFDLPAVAARARERVAVIAGNAFADPLPEGFDIVTLVRVLHDHDDGPARALLRKIHDSLAPGGTLVIAEPLAGTRGAEPAGAAYFGMYLLAMSSGRPRTRAEITEMLRDAGFSAVREHRTNLPLIVRTIAAKR